MLDYEALILGLRAAKDLGIKELVGFGDSELVIQQIKSVYQVNQYLLKVYRNEAWDLIEIFLAFNITFVPREYNETTDSLALAAAYFKVPKVIHLKYPIDERHINTNSIWALKYRDGCLINEQEVIS